MDPNATLVDMLYLASLVAAYSEEPVSEELANAVLDLNDWLCMGGALPRDWSDGTAETDE